ELAATETVADLVSSLDLADGRIAVEINGAVVPKSEHERRQFAENDQVEFIAAIGGG
ncbi:MAG: sulfur carrier protein ThiS, partial [Gammaproteobacteria bacterium]